MKSILSLLLALAMLVSCVAFAEGNTLTGTAMGMKHPITVEVDLDGETIADVRVVECEDTATIRDADGALQEGQRRRGRKARS